MLVIGYGNPLREDDGFGWHAIAALREAGLPAELLHVPQLAPDLAHRISRADTLVFLDARCGQESGRVQCERLEPAPELPAASQGLTPALLLLYAQRLYGRVPPAFVVCVAGERFGHGQRLSERLQELLPRVVRCVVGILEGAQPPPPRPRPAGPALGR